MEQPLEHLHPPLLNLKDILGGRLFHHPAPPPHPHPGGFNAGVLEWPSLSKALVMGAPGGGHKSEAAGGHRRTATVLGYKSDIGDSPPPGMKLHTWILTTCCERQSPARTPLQAWAPDGGEGAEKHIPTLPKGRL